MTNRIIKSWYRIDCYYCAGHGQVGNYGDGTDFYGPEDCGHCCGTGAMWVSKNGRIADYPGGPFRGSLPQAELLS